MVILKVRDTVPKNKDTLYTIYLLRNKISGMLYVGQTKYQNPRDRMGPSGDAYKNSPRIYAAIKEFGCDNFEYSIVATACGTKAADELETFYMHRHDTKNPDKGYNLKNGGNHGLHSEETKKQISETQLEKCATMTEEEKKAKAAPIMGWWEGKERGPHTEEWKQENGARTKERHATVGHPMEGRHQSEEAKNAIGRKNEGRKRDPAKVKERAKKAERNQDIEKDVVAMKKEGKTAKEICAAFGIYTSTLYRILHRNNVKIMGLSEEERANKSKDQKAQWENKLNYDEAGIIAAYNNGDTFTAIYKKFNAHNGITHSILKKHNIPKR